MKDMYFTEALTEEVKHQNKKKAYEASSGVIASFYFKLLIFINILFSIVLKNANSFIQ